jgi:pseudouridine synthase
MKIRIKQFLSNTGKFGSNEEIINAIINNSIKINNKTVTNPNYFINPKLDKVTYNDEIIRKMKKSYFMLNKPNGYLSSKLSLKDKELGKKSAFELFNNLELSEAEKNSLFLVGRLDEDSEGLIIATNDDELSINIASPKSSVEKEYECSLKNKLSSQDIEKIQKGVKITLEKNGKFFDYSTKPAKITAKGSKANIILTESKKREIRRIFEALGNEVLSLKLVRIGNLILGDLKPKEFKEIKRDMI